MIFLSARKIPARGTWGMRMLRGGKPACLFRKWPPWIFAGDRFVRVLPQPLTLTRDLRCIWKAQTICGVH